MASLPCKGRATLSTKPCRGPQSREVERDQILTSIQVLDPAIPEDLHTLNWLSNFCQLIPLFASAFCTEYLPLMEGAGEGPGDPLGPLVL